MNRLGRLLVVLGGIGLLLVSFASATTGIRQQNRATVSPIESTRQQQTIDAVVREILGGTATAQQQFAVTQTVQAAVNNAISQTLAVESALTKQSVMATTSYESTATVEGAKLARITEIFESTGTADAVQMARATANFESTATARVVEATANVESIATEVAQTATATAIAHLPLELRSAYIPPKNNRDWIPVERNFNDVTMVLVPVGCYQMGSLVVPTATNAQVEIVRILKPGDITLEAVEIQNRGEAVNLLGWKLTDAEGNVFEFPEQLLFTDGIVTVFTRDGQDTPIVLFWGRGASVWNVEADVATLKNADGEVQSSNGYGFDEQLLHEQCITEPFWLDKYEVTNTLYGPASGSSSSSEADQPRTNVTWLDAQAFCEARGGTLPSEMQWEYAARGVESWVYPWGNEYHTGYVVGEDNQVYGDKRTAPVGSRPEGASWVGAMDMSGNVGEWTHTRYVPYPYQDETNGYSAGDVSNRALRGGSFNDSAVLLRSAFRVGGNIINQYDDVGFRCAFSLTSPTPTPVPPTATPIQRPNLAFNGSPLIQPFPPKCKDVVAFYIRVQNNGQVALGSGWEIYIRDIHVASNSMSEFRATFDSIPAGESIELPALFLSVDTNFDSEHRIEVILDSSSNIVETNEADNIHETARYTLTKGAC